MLRVVEQKVIQKRQQIGLRQEDNTSTLLGQLKHEENRSIQEISGRSHGYRDGRPHLQWFGTVVPH